MMPQVSVETQNLKPSQRRLWGCLRLLLIPLIIVGACYGGMWLFARYGGEWSMSDQIPIPRASEQMNVLYADAEFMMKSAFYSSAQSPEVLRDWFVEQGIWVSEKEFADNDRYYAVLGYDLLTDKRNTYRSIVRTLRPDMAWMTYVNAGCDGWTVFKSLEAARQVFPQVNFDVAEGKTVFAIHTCWPNALGPKRS